MAVAQSRGKRFLSKFGIYFVLLLTSVIVIFPFYMTVLTSFKQPADARNFILALPEKWTFTNFQQVLTRGGYWPALQNSTVVTIFATFGTMLLNTILSYFLGRNQSKPFFNFAYYWFIIGIFIPFQVVMIPLVVLGKTFGMLNIPGLICMHIALSFPTNVFMMTGFVKGVPRDVDEAAMIDGCGPIRTFYQIIMPMMSPIIATTLVSDRSGCLERLYPAAGYPAEGKDPAAVHLQLSYEVHYQLQPGIRSLYAVDDSAYGSLSVLPEVYHQGPGCRRC